MIRRFLIVASVALAGASFAQDAAPATQPSAPSTQPARNKEADASYGIGYQLGQKAYSACATLDPEKVLEGLKDGLSGKEPSVAEQDVEAGISYVQQTATKVLSERNAKAGDAFRAENGKKQGVVTTASGLQIETIKEGTGEQPKPTDNVKVHYTGTLIDGKKFDSSVDRGEPVTFPLNRVIKGWSEGVGAMKVGGKAKLTIPPEIGYGAEGTQDGTIPPNATLVFEVELLEIVKEAAAPAPAPTPEPGK